MKRHYYLDKLGVEYPHQWCPGDEREKKWKKERKKYGFDSRETWSLDGTFFMWLYEHLEMFMKCADGVVDLNFHVIKIGDEEKTQREWILECISVLKKSLQNDDFVYRERRVKDTDRVMQIWSAIYNYMWW